MRKVIELIWKPIINIYDIIDNMYEINQCGEVRNINSGIVLKSCMINSGYLTYVLRCKTIKCRRFLIHRLVALVFIKNNNPERIFVNHLDGNKTRNDSLNLQWCTQKENNIHAVKYGLIKSGEDSKSSKLSNNQVHAMCKMIEKGISYKEILSALGLPVTDNNRDLVGNIKRKIAWLSISQYYNF